MEANNTCRKQVKPKTRVKRVASQVVPTNENQTLDSLQNKNQSVNCIADPATTDNNTTTEQNYVQTIETNKTIPTEATEPSFVSIDFWVGPKGLCALVGLLVIAFVFWKTFIQKTDTSGSHSKRHKRKTGRRNRSPPSPPPSTPPSTPPSAFVASPADGLYTCTTSTPKASFLSSVGSVFHWQKKKKKKIKRMQGFNAHQQKRQRRPVPAPLMTISSGPIATTTLTSFASGLPHSSLRSTVEANLERHRRNIQRPVAFSKVLSNYFSSH